MRSEISELGTPLFVYTVKPLNKVHLVDVMTLIIMIVYMEQNQVCLLL